MKAIKLLSSGRAPGSDAIPAEIYKAGDTPGAGRWQSYFTLCGEKKPSIKKSRMHQLSTYLNGKGIRSCVIIIVAPLYCRLLGRSLQDFYLTDRMNTFGRSRLLPESKCGFRKDRRTIDMIFTERQLQEKCQEQNMDSTWPLLTLPKHFAQSVVRVFGKLWPTKFIAMVRQFHDGVLARVQNDGEFFLSIPCDKWC